MSTIKYGILSELLVTQANRRFVNTDRERHIKRSNNGQGMSDILLPRTEIAGKNIKTWYIDVTNVDPTATLMINTLDDTPVNPIDGVSTSTIVVDPGMKFRIQFDGTNFWAQLQ
jgi:hypothetical protein